MAGLELVQKQSPNLTWLIREPSRQSQPPPAMLFLHGFDEGAPTLLYKALTRHGPLLKAPAEFAVVAPQLPKRGDLWAGYAQEAVDFFLRLVAEGDWSRQHCYLTGFSFGGNGVFDVALAHPEPWAALWPVDPTRVPVRNLDLPVWFSSGELSRRAEERFIERLGLLPATDGARVYEDRGVDHVGTATVAYADDRIYQWLLSMERSH